MFLPSRSLSNVSAVVHSVAGPVPFTVMADTRKAYSVPRSRAGQTTQTGQIQSPGIYTELWLNSTSGGKKNSFIKTSLSFSKLILFYNLLALSTRPANWGFQLHNKYFESTNILNRCLILLSPILPKSISLPGEGSDEGFCGAINFLFHSVSWKIYLSPLINMFWW